MIAYFSVKYRLKNIQSSFPFEERCSTKRQARRIMKRLLRGDNATSVSMEEVQW